MKIVVYNFENIDFFFVLTAIVALIKSSLCSNIWFQSACKYILQIKIST